MNMITYAVFLYKLSLTVTYIYIYYLILDYLLKLKINAILLEYKSLSRGKSLTVKQIKKDIALVEGEMKTFRNLLLYTNIIIYKISYACVYFHVMIAL